MSVASPLNKSFKGMEIDITGKNIFLLGTFFPNRFENQIFNDLPSDHHLLTSRQGRAYSKALIETDVDDQSVLFALLLLRATPGNNLPEESWSERGDPTSPYPDLRVQGTECEAFLILGSETYPLQQIFQGSPSMELHFGGHEALIHRWRSGCIICLYSCPGARISDAKRTIRMGLKRENRYRLTPFFRNLPEGSPMGFKIHLKEGQREGP